MKDADPQQQQKKTEKEMMQSGQLYFSQVKSLTQDRKQARILIHEFNNLNPATAKRADFVRIYKQLFGTINEQWAPFIEPPLRVDYGYNIHFGENVFINFNAVILDCAPVHIGNRVLIGPNCTIVPPCHPLSPEVRNGTNGPEYAKPVTIEDDVWIASNVVICPGVTIGKGAIIGSGSIVVKDVPPLTLVAGNPAKPIRKVTDGDLKCPPMRYTPFEEI